MKNITAAAILSSISTIIGFGIGGVLGSYESFMKAEEMYEIAKSCQDFKTLGADSQTIDRVMFVKAMVSEDEELRESYESNFIQKLSKDALELNRQISNDLTDEELKSKKELIEMIEGLLKEVNAKKNL